MVILQHLCITLHKILIFRFSRDVETSFNVLIVESTPGTRLNQLRGADKTI